MRWLLLLLCCLAGPAAADQAAEAAFARALLTDLQARSIAQNREYCGVIGVDQNGRLIASKPRRGRRDRCRPRDPRGAVQLLASFHTHAAFDPDAISELPSVSDVISDIEEGIDGYLSTPGGRFWFINGQTGRVLQICGIGCLPSDPDFVPGVWGVVRPSYTLEQLERALAD